MKDLIKQVSNIYLTKYISVDEFNNIISTYQTISKNGLLARDLSEKEIISQYFQNAIPDNFFEKKDNIQLLLSAVPEQTLNMVFNDLGLKSLDEVSWNNEVSKYFINNFNLDEKFIKDDLSSKSNLSDDESIIYFNKKDQRFKKLKSFQADIAYRLYEYLFDTPYARAILQMPTGSGKTRTSIEIACDFINETEKNVIWLANTEELCEQAFLAFNEVWSFIGSKEVASVNHQRHKISIDSNVQKFQVTSIQSVLYDKNLKKLGIDVEKIGLVIVDEAHISIAPRYEEAIKKLISKGAKLLGLTATPGRHLGKSKLEDEDDDSTKWSGNKKLSEFYFNKRFKIDISGKNPIEFLRTQGVLSLAKFIPLEGAYIDKQLKSSVLETMDAEKKIPKIIEKLLSNNAERNSMIFEQLVEILSKGKKIIFFGTSVSHSKMISTLLKMKGYSSAHIDGNSGSYRKKIIDDFKSGSIQILCNYGVLSTGFDDPQIDVVFMARPTNSIVLYSQIIGRGLRGPAVGGTKTCEIFTVIDNIVDLPDNQDIFDYFDGYFI